MDAVAKASGMSKSTVYVYFRSKESMFLHLVLEGLSELRDTVRGLTGTCSTAEAFHSAVCECIIDMHNREPLFFHSIVGVGPIGEARRFHPNLAQQIDALREEILLAIVDALAATGYGIAHEMDEGERLELGYVLWACMYGIIRLGEAQSWYIGEQFGKEKWEFMRKSFERLLNMSVTACPNPTCR